MTSEKVDGNMLVVMQGEFRLCITKATCVMDDFVLKKSINHLGQPT